MAMANQIKLNWYQALTVNERMAIPREADLAFGFDGERAERRLRRWKQQPPFDTGRYFEERLASDGITESDLLTLLGESSDVVPAGETSEVPTWMAALTEAYERAAESEALDLSALRGEQGTADLVDFAEPLIRQGLDRLRQKIAGLNQEHVALPFAESALASLFVPNLLPKLSIIAGRTLVLELNVARLQGKLQGETPEERYENYIEQLRRPEVALAIFEEYPVLARQLSIAVDQWVEVSFEFLARLAADWEQIRATFCAGDEPGRLVEAAGGAGDSHKGGRSVMLLKFESGFRLVYKPRSLAVDVHFQELLEWLNARGDHPPFRTLSVLDREAYGWVEFVTAAECKDAEELHRFYERQGAYLALLYTMEASDFHLENLIASGEHPVLLDLEALFHPHPIKLELKNAEDQASHRLWFSVMSVGLLPHRIWETDQSSGIDMSGFGGQANQLTPFEVPQWDAVATDEIRLVKKRMPIEGARNLPSLNGQKANALEWADAIAAGFTNLYQLLVEFREELLSDAGPIARFATVPVRAIIRDTRSYGRLLYESFHPDLLRNAIERERYFDRLWIQACHQPHLIPYIPAERADLLAGDVPFFSTCPGSREVWSGREAGVVGQSAECGLEVARTRIRQMCEEDLSRQLWMIRASLATLAEPKKYHSAHSKPSIVPDVKPSDADRQGQIIRIARDIGDRLGKLSLRGKQDASWIGLSVLDREGNYTLRVLEGDLYDGLSGVALFLGYLGEITSTLKYTELSRGALTTLRQQIESQRSITQSIGAFSGLSGAIYALSHLGVIWRDPALLAEAEAMVERLGPLIPEDRNFDIVAGAAGAIGGLLSLFRARPSENTLRAAIQCGDHLLASATAFDTGIGWLAPGESRALSGISHGGAGIAMMLLRLSAVSGETRFRDAAIEALQYERTLFSAEARNWKDLREGALEKNGGHEELLYELNWCHGAPGVGLARISMLPFLEDELIREEISTAVETTIDHGAQYNHSLCHGEGGNLELLIEASEKLNDPSARRALDQRTGLLLQATQKELRCANPLYIESPGLMTGIAGTGYALLRIAFPQQVPSVLALEAPLL